MRTYKKKDFPVENIRRFLEPGPVLLVSSHYKGESNIMSMGWHMVMDASGSHIGCYIWDQNHSQQMIRKSRECVFNIPSTDLAEKVIGIGNCSGAEVDKFQKFDLTPLKASKVSAPLIKECFANFECRLIETSLIKKYNFFIFDVVKAHVAQSPKFPETLHYRGDGYFMISGPTVKRYRKLFDPSMLD